MNAIELLESQHREIEDLFSEIEEARDAQSKDQLLEELADTLIVHAAIEEHHFYPAVKAKRTEEILLESLEEHLVIKDGLDELLKIDASDDSFDAKVKVLKEHVERHVDEEEGDLFPKVRKLLSAEQLHTLARDMMAEQAEIEEGDMPTPISTRTESPSSLS